MSLAKQGALSSMGSVPSRILDPNFCPSPTRTAVVRLLKRHENEFFSPLFNKQEYQKGPNSVGIKHLLKHSGLFGF